MKKGKKSQLGSFRVNLKIPNVPRIPVLYELDPLIKRLLYGGLGLLAFFIGFALFWQHIISPPDRFITHTTIEIPDGATLSEVGDLLKSNSLIRSKMVFLGAVIAMDGETSIQAGRYLFEQKIPVFFVAKRVILGDFGIPRVKITVPEGSTVFDIATRLRSNFFPSFSEREFVEAALPHEGFLFPDTYYFPEGTTVAEIVDEMTKNSKEQLASLRRDAEAQEKEFHDIMVMASIIEKEANTYDSRRLISGILWKRMEIDMPLQVDATFNYVNGKNTFELTLEDLKIDSPYNTYVYKGLPPAPIANPSVDSIHAALNPTESDYLYYLSDRAGNMYYGRDFEEHKENKWTYLN